jgi:hypothetical protein
MTDQSFEVRDVLPCIAVPYLKLQLGRVAPQEMSSVQQSPTPSRARALLCHPTATRECFVLLNFAAACKGV